MVTAKAFGMKVTRYFVGFGPTLFSFRRGETEYGVKAIPLGGFVKIVGMTPQDDDVEPGGRAAGDVALPGVEAHDRDGRRLADPLRARLRDPLGRARLRRHAGPREDQRRRRPCVDTVLPCDRRSTSQIDQVGQQVAVRPGQGPEERRPTSSACSPAT